MLRLSTVALALIALGCGTNDQPCNRFVRDGERFEVTVLGRSDPAVVRAPLFLDGLPSCGLDDIQEGSRREVTLSEFVDWGGENGCQQAVCPSDLPVAAAPLGRTATQYSLPYVCSAHDTKVELAPQCQLGRFVGLYQPSGATELYAASNGVAPAFTLVRALTQADGIVSCSDVATRFPSAPPQGGYVCADQWQVSLAKR